MASPASDTQIDLPGPLDALRTRLAPLGGRWAKLAERERWLVGGALVLVLGALIWMLAVQPALRTLREAPARLVALDLELQSMQRMAAEARELRNAPPVTVVQSTLALQAATSRLGAGAQLDFRGERAVLQLDGVGPQALRDWLQEVRSGARARIVEAQLVRSPQGYTGTVTVALAGLS